MLRAFRATGPAKSPKSRSETQFHPQLELLEPRMVMTSLVVSEDGLPVLSHDGGCACPICSGQGLETLFPAEFATTTGTSSSAPAGASPLSSLPQLSSNSGARVKLFLDFNGDYQSSWGSYTNVTTRVFDRDGDESTFSDSELTTIREIWARVAEDYAPFNIDVTTIDPGNFANGNAVKLAIGGDYSDWFGQAAGGVAYVGGFTNSASNVGYVFEDALGNGTARYVAEATSHEAGHLFGLWHQSTYVNGQLQDEYNSGNSSWAPIMGVGYYSARTTWHNGPNNLGPSSYQDDVSILANSTNGFGLRGDDYSSSFGAASTLPVSGSSVSFTGYVGSRTDVDVFLFQTSGGTVSFQLSGIQYGSNLDGALEIRETNQSIRALSDPSDSYGASASATLDAGWYFLVVRGAGQFANSTYGNMGQYTITGIVPAPAASPEVTVTVNGSDIVDGGTIDFGSTTVGTAVERTVTVRNSGSAPLSISSITSAMPAGFTLVSNLPTTTLQAGQSATFVVRLITTTVGSFAGNISFANSDANEGTYDLRLQGAVATSGTTSGGAGSTSSVRIIDDGAAGTSTYGAWRTGSRGRDGDVHVASKATNITAMYRWTFGSLAPGQYRVWMSWTGDAYNASNAPVTFLSGSQNLGSMTVNQRVASSGLSAEGTNWTYLRTVTISGTSLTVRLANNANGNVVADAVRIERVATAAQFGGAENAYGAGVYVASLSSRENAGFSGLSHEQPTSQPELTLQQRRDEVFAGDLDLSPEMQLLDETLDLLREASSHRKATSNSGAGECSELSVNSDLALTSITLSE